MAKDPVQNIPIAPFLYHHLKCTYIYDTIPNISLGPKCCWKQHFVSAFLDLQLLRLWYLLKLNKSPHRQTL